MNKKIKKLVQVVLVIAVGALALRLLAQTCLTTTVAFTENFSGTNYENLTAGVNSVSGWPPGPIQLNKLGANFTLSMPATQGAEIYCCDRGDFNGDGYPDLVGLKLTGPSSDVQASSQLELVWNTWKSSGGKTPYTVDPVTDKNPIDKWTTNVGPACIVVGNFSGHTNGMLDFFFWRASADSLTSYSNFLACMYINYGTPTVPKFYPSSDTTHNLVFTSAFENAVDSKGAKGIYASWTSDHFCAIDLYNTGNTDIIIGSGNKIWVLLNPGPGLVSGKPKCMSVSNWGLSELSYNQRPGFIGTKGAGTAYPDGYTDRGVSTIAAANFRNNGDIDIVCGTVNSANYLAYYSNDGTGHFTFNKIVIPNVLCYGPTGFAVADFENIGRMDIFAAGDGWNTVYQQGYMWILMNQGPSGTVVNWSFQCLNNCAKYPWGNDADIVFPVDYNDNGNMDIIITDANNSFEYYLLTNSIAAVYGLNGQAQSIDLVGQYLSNGVTSNSYYLNPTDNAITSVQLTNLTQTYVGPSSTGLTVSLYFTNDGTDWELYGTYTGSQIATINNSGTAGWYNFEHYGSNLEWRIILSATNNNIPGYTNASYSTPSISQLSIQYQYVARQEYSRSSAATTIVTPAGVQHQLLIGTSFIYPGWQGELRAYDVTGMTGTSGTYSNLYTVTSSNLSVSSGRNLQTGVNVYWDAGQILQGVSPTSRTVYTAIRANGKLSNPLTRLNFTAANAATLAPFLNDVENDPTDLINFVLGTGRSWILGDINHSSPLIVGPPSGNPTLLGSAYATFATAEANRPTVLYVGANDGMLHCFDILTGSERWAFIPYNLLPALTNEWKVDSTNDTRFYYHQVYVDGTPSVSDVMINGQWRTVLICGQGPGRGSTMDGGYNYYFALDITDPTNPQPLWEFTHVNASRQYTTGETISVPAIGQINISGTPTWVAFMGSGYDNIDAAPVPGATPVGKNFYVVRIDNGQLVWTQAVTDVDTSTFTSPRTPYPNIPDAIPGSPTALDVNNDGFIEYVYVGDLDGRLYKLDVTSSTPSSWALSAIYTDYMNYPIITKPAVWINPFASSNVPWVFFGTGGDDGAPSTGNYAFIALQDTGTVQAPVEWYIGVPSSLNLPATAQVGSATGLGTGYKVWADPVISNSVIYFTTLQGSIESVNPCANLSGAGELYARILQPGAGLPVGATALKSNSTVPPEYLTLESKARQAVTLGSIQSSGTTESQQVFIQEYDSTIQMLTQPVGASLLIKSWREVYQIFTGS